ncbi:ribonuclease HII [Candidatus Wolfebacteria bacterium]|nr:ribonuclease HII [Candidatus Wolfebacteria bacterium]
MKADKYIIGIDEVGRAAQKKRASLAQQYVIGIDEVGRGSLAGEVTVAALMLPQRLEIRDKKLGVPLRDSKKLTRRQRGKWFDYIKNNGNIFYATASVGPKTIDRVNISNAANRAASIALARLIANSKSQIARCRIFLDGGLRLQESGAKNLDSRFRGNDIGGGGNGVGIKAKTVIRGDEKIPAITLASIAAKVTRDRRMRLWDKKYPGYAFLTNVGYGTKMHREALLAYGPTPLHRLTFIKKYTNLTND